MPKVRIVTDSTARFRDAGFPRRHSVAVLPLTIHVGQMSFRDGLDIDAYEFMNLLADGEVPFPSTSAPSPEEFGAVYQDLALSANHILSLHVSSRLSDARRNARLAVEEFVGPAEVVVMDSRTTSYGLGYLVEAAVRAADEGATLDEIVRRVRGLIPHMYAVFFVETLDHLEHSGRLRTAQAILGTMLGVKVILTLEDGDLIPMEKVRTRAQGIEKLVEFVGEFTSIERLTVLHSNVGGANHSRQLLDRLATAFPKRHIHTAVYDPILASQIGPYGLGVIVYEGVDEGNLAPPS